MRALQAGYTHGRFISMKDYTNIRVWKKTQLRLRKLAVKNDCSILKLVDDLSLGKIDKKEKSVVLY